MRTDPPRTVAISRPNAAASSRPRTTAPRITMRTRHRSRETNRAVSSHANSMNGAVSLPSRLLVTARIGIRMIEGNSPKYVYW